MNDTERCSRVRHISTAKLETYIRAMPNFDFLYAYRQEKSPIFTLTSKRQVNAIFRKTFRKKH